MFARNVQICAKFCCKNSNDVCQVFPKLHHYTWGRAFSRGDAVVYRRVERLYVGLGFCGGTENWRIYSVSTFFASISSVEATDICGRQQYRVAGLVESRKLPSPSNDLEGGRASVKFCPIHERIVPRWLSASSCF